MELDTGTPEKQVPAVLEMEHREDIEVSTVPMWSHAASPMCMLQQLVRRLIEVAPAWSPRPILQVLQRPGILVRNFSRGPCSLAILTPGH